MSKKDKSDLELASLFPRHNESTPESEAVQEPCQTKSDSHFNIMRIVLATNSVVLLCCVISIIVIGINLTGREGPQGPPGVKGKTGSMGREGRQGIKGDPGSTGYKGQPGSTGPRGPQGFKGEKGMRGLHGFIGFKGDKGETGETGIQGKPGIKGSSGQKGSNGEQGQKGEKGTPGMIGIAGMKGDKGGKEEKGELIKCKDGWVAFDRSCYFIEFKAKKAFADAQQDCLSRDASLTKIDNMWENWFLKSLVREGNTGGVYLGLHDIIKEGKFVWLVDNSTLTFNDWGPGQPDNAGKREDCVHYWKGAQYKWNDYPCTLAQGYICEIAH